MKRYCFLIFLLLLSISALKAQYVDEWNYMKERYLSFLRNPDANFEELNESNNPFDLYVSCDFQVDEWQYTIISKEDRTVSVHPRIYYYNTGDSWAPSSWTPDTTLSGTIKIPSHVAYKDTLYTVTTITEGAFYFCVTIDSLIIPETITSIEEFAFTQSFIKSYIFLGDVLKTIGNGAFLTIAEGKILHRHCYMYSRTPPKGTVFLTFNEKEPNGLLHVPVGCKEAYQQAEGWKQYGENIVDDINLEGIHHAQLKTQDSDAPTYDLQGRRVENPKQGEIYIQKGKKIRK